MPGLARAGHPEAPITRLDTAAYRIPTDQPEADGTYRWDSTTLVVVHATGGGARGFGYTYASSAVVRLVREHLADLVLGRDALSVEGAWWALLRSVRNIGRAGIAANAISAIDAALWDLKAKLLGLPLVTLLGDVRDAAPVYGSGGFTTYSVETLCEQLVRWVAAGIPRVKMKIGTDPEADEERVGAVRRAIGDHPALMVDANGAYSRAEAVGKAHAFARHGVTWFEEPVSSDDVEGLRAVRDRAPPGMAIAAGEYGYDLFSLRRLVETGAVDVLQADATRCLGITGFLAASRLCQAFGIPLSAHTAPSLHAHPACACEPLVHIEYFHDHARIEQLLFDGFVVPEHGAIRPDRTRPGLGIELASASAKRFEI